MKLFVFGTLKAGFPLHHNLAGAKLLGYYRTVQRFPMVVAGPWFAPMLLDQPGQGLQVKGELYEIHDRQLAVLDQLESVGKPGNFRRVADVESIATGTSDKAFIFMKSPQLASPIHTSNLEDYQDNRFVPPDQRSPCE